ncbi:hypothetical protein ACGYK7_17160, partial [Sulfitobacter sp. 1A15299]
MSEEDHTASAPADTTKAALRKRKERVPLFNDQDKDNISWFWTQYLKQRAPWLGLVMVMILIQGFAYQQFISLTESG